MCSKEAEGVNVANFPPEGGKIIWSDQELDDVGVHKGHVRDARGTEAKGL
jgi:hypothetical protein